MHFCVIGDSWARNAQLKFQNLFEQFNHTVANISTNGASNQGQLRKLENSFFDKGKQCDCILWIYTEPVRDFTEFVSLDYGDDVATSKQLQSELTFNDFYADLRYLADKNFQHAERLYKKFDTPFVVIGAAGVVDECIDTYNFPLWTLSDWKKTIVDYQYAPVNCYHHHVVKMADFGNYKKQDVLCEISRLDILNAMMTNDAVKFPDKSHPSLDYYPDLVASILMHLGRKGLQ